MIRRNRIVRGRPVILAGRNILKYTGRIMTSTRNGVYKNGESIAAVVVGIVSVILSISRNM